MSTHEEQIDDAISQDLKWLTGEAQQLEAWRGTEPQDVGVLDLGDQSAVSVMLRSLDVSDDEHDRLLAYAQKQWKKRARRYERYRIAKPGETAYAHADTLDEARALRRKAKQVQGRRLNIYDTQTGETVRPEK